MAGVEGRRKQVSFTQVTVRPASPVRAPRGPAQPVILARCTGRGRPQAPPWSHSVLCSFMWIISPNPHSPVIVPILLTRRPGGRGLGIPQITSPDGAGMRSGPPLGPVLFTRSPLLSVLLQRYQIQPQPLAFSFCLIYLEK